MGSNVIKIKLKENEKKRAQSTRGLTEKEAPPKAMRVG